jgi:hypothetical protein
MIRDAAGGRAATSLAGIGARKALLRWCRSTAVLDASTAAVRVAGKILIAAIGRSVFHVATLG